MGNCNVSNEQAEPEDEGTSLNIYFQRPYLDGEPYDATWYKPYYDQELQICLLKHEASGIRIWSEALDLRASAPASRAFLLYHYTGRKALTSILDRSNKPADIIEALESEAHHFGVGMLTNAREPRSYKSKDAVLFNNYWPRAHDALKVKPGQVKSVLKSGNPAKGPEHAANNWVCNDLRDTLGALGKVDFCIPMLVPQCFVYDLWDRVTPDLEGEVAVGCNRFGEQQWEGRDICIVQLTDEGRRRLTKSGWSGNVKIAQKRVACLERREGVNHTETLSAVSDLAVLLQAMGRHEEAKPLLRRVIASRVPRPAEVHCDAEKFRLHLGKVVKGSDKQHEAELRLRRIMEGCDKVLGSGHPYTLTAVTDLAELLQSMGRQVEAIGLLRSALDSKPSEPGPESCSPEALRATTNLAALLQASGQHGEAGPMLQQALERAEQQLGPAHPTTVQTFHDLAMMQKAMADVSQAEATLRRAMHLCERELGRSHNATLQVVTELAVLLQAAGRSAEAEELLRRSLTVREEDLGESHPDTVISMENLAAFLKAMGNQAEAEPMLERVSQLSRQNESFSV